MLGRVMNKTNDRIIVALDLPSVREAEALVDKLGNTVSFYKIGLALTSVGGFELAEKLKSSGKRIFLDLKLFDISQTIENAVKNIEKLKVDFLTIHGDPQVVRAAARARSTEKTKILAVTLLTSMDRFDLSESLIKEGTVNSLVLERASRAFLAGADGVIASPIEAAEIRSLAESEDKLIVTPGIRPSDADVNDQKRVWTPKKALNNGADFIVIGRPIYESKSPLTEINKIISELKY